MTKNFVIEKSVIFICHESSRTGAPLSLLTLLEYLAEKKFFHFYILINKGGELSEQFKRVGPTLVLHPKRPDFFLTRFWVRWSRRLTRKQKIFRFIKTPVGLIYSNTSANGRLSALLKKMYRVPVLTNIRELQSIMSSMGAKNLRLVMDSTDHFIAVSRAAKNNLVINYKVPEEKITVVYGAVKVPVEGIHRKTEIPEMYNLPETNFIVGAAGRVDHIKGYDLFIDIAEEVCHGHKKKDIIFVWAGSFGRGKRESVNEKIYAKNLIGNVFFTGELKEPFGLYALFDVWLIPSREDTFPRVILEAAVLGKPSLCFEDSGGGIEFVEDKKNGILIPDFDIHAAAEAIIGLCADRKWLNELGENAKRKVLSGFTINQQGENYFHIINRFLERE